MPNQKGSEICFFSMPRALAAVYEKMIKRVLNGKFRQIEW